MDRTTELALIDEIGELLANGTTSMAPDVMRVPPGDLIDPQRAREEHHVLFRRYPLVVAPSAAVPNPGDFVTEDFAGLPLLVVRDDDGAVRVFVNLCRHRGNRLCDDESGNKRVFACPYHAWTFGRDGKCRGVVDKEGFRGIDRADYGLLEYPCEERHGLVWTLPAHDATLDVAAYLGPELDAELAGYLRHTQHVYRRVSTSQPFNWKLGVNTFQELFHLAFLHKETLGKAFISNVTAFRSYEPHQRLTVVRSTFPDMLTLPEAERSLFPHCSLVYVLFPNVVLTWQLDHLELWRFTPSGDPGSCQVDLWLLTEDEPTSDASLRHWERNWAIVRGVVEGEDFKTMALIQDAAASELLPHMVYGRNEIGLQDYYLRLGDALERGGRATASHAHEVAS